MSIMKLREKPLGVKIKEEFVDKPFRAVRRAIRKIIKVNKHPEIVVVGNKNKSVHISNPKLMDEEHTKQKFKPLTDDEKEKDDKS